MIDTEYLRVKQIDTGHVLTVSRTQYDFAPAAYEVLQDAATDAGNNPLPTVYAGSDTDESTADEGDDDEGDEDLDDGDDNYLGNNPADPPTPPASSAVFPKEIS